MPQQITSLEDLSPEVKSHSNGQVVDPEAGLPFRLPGKDLALPPSFSPATVPLHDWGCILPGRLEIDESVAVARPPFSALFTSLVSELTLTVVDFVHPHRLVGLYLAHVQEAHPIYSPSALKALVIELVDASPELRKLRQVGMAQLLLVLANGARYSKISEPTAATFGASKRFLNDREESSPNAD